jgi:hypothetical protein
MTFVDAITATAIIVVFLAALSQAFLPAHRAWEKAEAEYRAGQTLRFIAESFKSECAKPDRNMENWKKAIGAAKELESLELIEMREGEELRAIMARCFIDGEYIEIIGLCTP